MLGGAKGVLNFQDSQLLTGGCDDHAYFARADSLINSILLDLYGLGLVGIRFRGAAGRILV